MGKSAAAMILGRIEDSWIGGFYLWSDNECILKEV